MGGGHCSFVAFCSFLCAKVTQVKWPTARHKVCPGTVPSLSLNDAFSWPKKLMEKLPQVLEEIAPFGTPVVSTKSVMTVASNFSGICSQSRAAAALQSQPAFGITFKHVQNSAVPLSPMSEFHQVNLCSEERNSCDISPPGKLLMLGTSVSPLVCAQVSFTEKSRQCQKTLSRDYPGSCVFKDQLGVLDASGLFALSKAKGLPEISQEAGKAGFSSVAACAQHQKHCQLPRDIDLSFFGAPCADDSTQGTQKQDQGETRKESRLLNTIFA